MLGLAAAIACSGKRDEPAAQGGSAGGSAGSAAPAPPPKPEIELLSPGAEPRQILRYSLAKNATAHLWLDMTSALDTGDMKTASPPLHVALDVHVDDVLPDGRMKLTATIASLTAEGDGVGIGNGSSSATSQAAAHAGSAGAELVGLAITSTLSPDGHLTDVRAADRPLPPAEQALVPQLLADFEPVAMTWPTEPVGVGATWRRVLSELHAGPFVLHVDVVNELVARSGSAALSLAFTSQLRGDDQTVHESGIELTATHIAGSSSGSGTFDLASFAIDAAWTTTMHMDMKDNVSSTPMTMTNTIRQRSH